VAFPDTVAVPTVVPPDVQVLGAEDCGPKTMKVIVPEALEPDEPANTELIELAAMAVPAVPAPGALADKVGLALATTVSDIPEPHVEAALVLFVSPP